jgi:hypothetical protein
VSARAPRKRPAGLSRRRFVALAGAGLAAITAAAPALGAAAKSASKTKKSAAAPATSAPGAPPPVPASAQQKEFERQRTGTLATVKTIRAYALPPGGDLPVVFKPMRTPKKEH